MNLPGVINPSFNFLFWMFPVESLDVFKYQGSVVGPTGVNPRVTGLAPLGQAVFCVMLVRYGLRGILDGKKPWRIIVFCTFGVIAMLGGFRSTFLLLLMTFALLFYLERLHQTRLLVPVVFVFLAASGLLAIFAPRLPLSIQRSLTVVPFVQVDPVIRMDAQGSTEWRLQVWRDVLPEVPRYLLIGKGYVFSMAEQQDMRGTIESSELVGNYHNGPLSVIIPFGIFGAVGFLWFLVAGLRVTYQNYQLGDPAYHNLNLFLFAFLVAKIVFFFTIFGSFHSDMPMFLGLIALSISLNGGVAKPVVVPRPKIVFNRFKLHPSVRRPLGA
jgi:O-antigen ligase